MRPRSLGRLISIMSTLRARLSVPVSTKRKTHPIHDPPAGNLPDRSYGSRRHPPNLWALPWHAAVRFEHALQAARGLGAGPADASTAHDAVRTLDRAKWCLWHGRWAGC